MPKQKRGKARRLTRPKGHAKAIIIQHADEAITDCDDIDIGRCVYCDAKFYGCHQQLCLDCWTKELNQCWPC